MMRKSGRRGRGLARCIGALAMLAVAAPAGAAGTKPAKPLFADSAVVRLTIKAPIGKLTQGSAAPDTGVAGTLSVIGDAPETLAITLSPRGVKRREREVCGFPPLRVAFTAKPASTSLFRGQKTLKLVTHCRPGGGFQQHVLLEYAAYRLFNVMTPASFGARLVMIDYVDANGRAIVSRAAFFIEDADDVARRNGMREASSPGNVPVASIDPRGAVRFALFQDMIGNLDWAMHAGPPGADCCHNARLIGVKDAAAGLVPVPYDFDYSGLVDAPYAVPPAKIQVANVRVRRYRGFCRHNAEVAGEAAAMLAQRAELLAVLRDVPQLDDRARGKASDYLDSFFERIDGQPAIAAKILKTCV